MTACQCRAGHGPVAIAARARIRMLTYAEVGWRMLAYAVAVAAFARIPLSACAGHLKHSLEPYIEPLTHSTICVCVLSALCILAYICPQSAIYVSSADTYCYTCVLSALMHTTIYMSSER